MPTATEDLIRTAYGAFSRGDLDSVLELVDPELEWTFLDPSTENPEPQICRGRDQLAYWMGRGAGWRMRAELEEIVGYGDRVVVVTHSPGIDAIRARKTGDRNFHVITVRDGRIAALRACRSRDEAVTLASAAQRS
jgi:ketosteroid isomerase-like protein